MIPAISVAFVLGLCNLDEIRQITNTIDLPLNLMLVPEMPTIAELASAGARRFSVGPAFFQVAYGQAQSVAKELLHALAQQNSAAMFSPSIAYDAMNALF